MSYNRALVAFLTARMDEDEATAEAAGDDETEWRFDGQANPPRIEGAPWESSFHSGVWNCDDPDDDCWEFRLRGENTGEHIARHDPARMLREVAAKRDLIAAILAELHVYIPGDSWYSCSQAVDPSEDDPEYMYPGAGCSDDTRAGGPCDCGRDARVERLLRIMAQAYEGELT